MERQSDDAGNPARDRSWGYRMTFNEEWRPVEGYEHYQVSNLGRIRSARGILKSSIHASGYTRVGLFKDGVQKKKFLHVLVAAAFLGPKPKGMQVCHSPGSKRSDCELSKLRYGTCAENVADRWIDGTMQPYLGEGNPASKLTADNVQEIRKLRGVVFQHDLAKRFGVSRHLISAVHRKLVWRHL
jgi:hypothetical protein